MRIAIVMMAAVWLPSLASAQVISYTLVVTDLANTQVSTVNPGDPFKLQVFVADVRPNPQGVFAAYVDVSFDAALATANGPIVHSARYDNLTSGTSSAGQLDEVGGFHDISPPGPGMFLLFEQAFTATAAGTLTFSSDAADVTPLHNNLVFGSNTAVQPADIAFGTVTLTIAEAPIHVDGFEDVVVAR